jgi:hypothetical protein
MSEDNKDDNKSRLWKAVRFTDPAKTKRVKMPGGFTATTVDANWVLERATELFGPAGIGFGWQICNAFETQNRGLATVHIRFWYLFDGQRGEYDAIASNETDKAFRSGESIADSDAFKKALTDAIKNALTKIGFLADIHQGRHDDDEYVRHAKAYAENQTVRERAEKVTASKPEEKQASAAPAALTDEQQANALFIRLKRMDKDAAASIADQAGGDVLEEIDALARELGRRAYATLAKTDPFAAKAIMADTPKGEDGKASDPLAVLKQLDDAIALA